MHPALKRGVGEFGPYAYDLKDVPFCSMQGKVPVDIQQHESSSILFIMSDGDSYLMYHQENCCESVLIEDVCGDFQDLLGFPLLVSEEAHRNESPEGFPKLSDEESYTWTFYKLAGLGGSVTIRWLGTSNGYYSERVSLALIKPEHLELEEIPVPQLPAGKKLFDILLET